MALGDRHIRRMYPEKTAAAGWFLFLPHRYPPAASPRMCDPDPDDAGAVLCGGGGVELRIRVGLGGVELRPHFRGLKGGFLLQG